MELWAPDAPFCPACGSLLVFPDYGDVHCDRCPFTVSMAALPKTRIVTRSFPKPPPEWLVEYTALHAEKAGGVAVERQKGPKRAVVKEVCPKCGAAEMGFYTMQLRSADEGQTVFFECLDSACGHKHSVNT
jgi:DNA-directed RNA polymerase I subunit RPA12